MAVKKTMISRTIFCSAQAAVIRLAVLADALDLAQAVVLRLDDVEYLVAKTRTAFLA